MNVILPRYRWSPVAILVAIGLAICYNPLRNQVQYDTSFHVSSRVFPVTYLSSNPHNYSRILLPQLNPTQSADTSAIILNWSRLHNVVQIVRELCTPELNEVLATVFVWNNSPRKISYNDFRTASCSREKLQLYNSPTNFLFQARFLACAEASTTYCYIQDDDYFVWPEIIKTLRFRISRLANTSIHLLPPHESLSTHLRTVHLDERNIHTSFAWLGYGSIIRRSQAVEFLALMNRLNASREEMEMADNYFTILRNEVPEIWFDQGEELGGGQPFTVGSEGDERNKRHLQRALQYLDMRMESQTGTSERLTIRETPKLVRAPCLGVPCLLETSISVLPDGLVSSPSILEMLSSEESNLEFIGNDKQLHYLAHSPSYAVDDLSTTAFCSPEHAKSNDVLSLNMLSDMNSFWTDIEMAWLVDSDTVNILGASQFETSDDGINWVVSSHALSCTTTSGNSGDEDGLQECSIQMLSQGHRITPAAQFFRARLLKSQKEKWCVYEVWLRGRRRDGCL